MCVTDVMIFPSMVCSWCSFAVEALATCARYKLKDLPDVHRWGGIPFDTSRTFLESKRTGDWPQNDYDVSKLRDTE